MSEPHPVNLPLPYLGHWEASPTGVPYVHERASGVPGPEVLLTALVHGNEYSGAIALVQFLRSALVPRRGRITAAFCNMAAFARFDALKPDASRYVDEDFNRVWDAARLDGTADSVELRRARELRPFVERATHLLDLHSMHEPAAPLLVTGLFERNIAFAQALRTGAQVVADPGHADGVRMRDYGPFGEVDGSCIALLLEAGQHWEPASMVMARDMLMRFLVASGVLDQSDVPAGWLQADEDPPLPVQVTDRVVARSANFSFEADYRGGEVIAERGTVIAHDDGEPVCTPYDECVLVMPSVRQLKPGVTTLRMGRLMPRTPLAPFAAATN